MDSIRTSRTSGTEGAMLKCMGKKKAFKGRSFHRVFSLLPCAQSYSSLTIVQSNLQLFTPSHVKYLSLALFVRTSSTVWYTYQLALLHVFATYPRVARGSPSGPGLPHYPQSTVRMATTIPLGESTRTSTQT